MAGVTWRVPDLAQGVGSASGGLSSLLYALMATLLVLAGTIAGTLRPQLARARGHDVAARPVRARGHRCRPSRRLRICRSTRGRRSGAAASPSGGLGVRGLALPVHRADGGRQPLRRAARSARRRDELVGRGGTGFFNVCVAAERIAVVILTIAGILLLVRGFTKGEPRRRPVGRPHARVGDHFATSRRRFHGAAARSLRPPAARPARSGREGGVMSTSWRTPLPRCSPPRPRLLMVATSLAVAAGTTNQHRFITVYLAMREAAGGADSRLGAVVDHVPDDHRMNVVIILAGLRGRHPLVACRRSRTATVATRTFRALPHRGVGLATLDRDGVLVRPDAPRRERQRLLRHGRHDRRRVPRPARVRHGLHRIDGVKQALGGRYTTKEHEGIGTATLFWDLAQLFAVILRCWYFLFVLE